MMHLDQTTKSPYCARIQVVTCAGRKGTIVTSEHGTYLNLEGSRYWSSRDGYLHIDGGIIDAATQDVVRRFCTLYFARKLRIDCDGLFKLTPRVIRTGLSFRRFISSFLVYRGSLMACIGHEPKKWWKYRLTAAKITAWETSQIEQATYLDCPPLGASWQRFFKDRSWLKDAEKIKGDRIYLAH